MNKFPPLPLWEQIRRPKKLPGWYTDFTESLRVDDTEKGDSAYSANSTPSVGVLSRNTRLMIKAMEDGRWVTAKEVALILGNAEKSISKAMLRCVERGILTRRIKDGRGYKTYEYRLTVKVNIERGFHE